LGSPHLSTHLYSSIVGHTVGHRSYIGRNSNRLRYTVHAYISPSPHRNNDRIYNLTTHPPSPITVLNSQTKKTIAPKNPVHLAASYTSAHAPYYIPPTPPRASTTTSTSPTNTTATTMPTQTETRRASTPNNNNNSHTPSLHAVRTRSIGGPLSAGVIFERGDPASPPTDEDIIIVTVRISRKARRNSFDEPLPDR
jgi:hypothetical protein